MLPLPWRDYAIKDSGKHFRTPNLHSHIAGPQLVNDRTDRSLGDPFQQRYIDKHWCQAAVCTMTCFTMSR